jgi:putative phage-type endonuclease
MIQGTPEWLEMRKKMITATDACVIMNTSLFLTPYTLWEQKLNLSPPQKQNSAMKRGSDLESEALKCFNKEMNLSLQPKVILSTQLNWAMASLDGYDNETAVEIKCPNKDDHKVALNGKVPDKYFPQLQHQMFVANLKNMWYYSYDGTNGVSVFVEADADYQTKMIEKELEFYRCIKEFVPPTMTEKDFLKRNDLAWRELSQRYLNVKMRLKQFESEEKYLRDALVKAAIGQNCIGAGLKISKSIRKGAVDYKIIPELIGIDLEMFRSDPVVSYRITETTEGL